MYLIADIVGGFLGAGVVSEIGARLFYRKRFKVPWKSKLIGEYPYNEFVEKAKPPMYFQFKKGYHSKYVNINSLGMRSPEFKPDSQKKKLLVIGESIYFGPKILNEKNLWCYQLQDILQQNNIDNWDIYNAGFPGYNTYQYVEWWNKTLKDIKPDILILQLGANDITQASIMGKNWKPGTPWPWEFIMRQQRKSKWWQKLLFYSCLYFIYRRKKITESKGFEAADTVFKLEEIIPIIEENAKKIILEAQSMETKVILSSMGFVFDLNSLKENPPQLDSIQSNWRESMKSTGLSLLKFNNWWINEFSKEMNCPSLNLQKALWTHPKRYELHLDIFHWNEKGNKVVAEEIFNKIKRLGWW